MLAWKEDASSFSLLFLRVRSLYDLIWSISIEVSTVLTLIRQGPINVAFTLAAVRKAIMSKSAFVAFETLEALFAAALALRIAVFTKRTNRITIARTAALLRHITVVCLFATRTVWSPSVFGADTATRFFITNVTRCITRLTGWNKKASFIF